MNNNTWVEETTALHNQFNQLFFVMRIEKGIIHDEIMILIKKKNQYSRVNAKPITMNVPWHLKEQRYDRQQPAFRPYEHSDYRLNLELPQLSENMHIKDFLDSLNAIVKFFNYFEIINEMKVKSLTYKLIEGASTW